MNEARAKFEKVEREILENHPHVSGFCGPLALSVLTDLHGGDMVTFCRDEGIYRSGYGMAPQNINQCLADLTGHTVRLVEKPRGVKTPISAERHMPKKGKYLLYTRSHVIAMVDGKIIDWTEGRRHRITHVYKLEESA